MRLPHSPPAGSTPTRSRFLRTEARTTDQQHDLGISDQANQTPLHTSSATTKRGPGGPSEATPPWPPGGRLLPAARRRKRDLDDPQSDRHYPNVADPIVQLWPGNTANATVADVRAFRAQAPLHPALAS